MNIIDKLSGSEILSVDKVMASMNLGLVLLIVVSPVLIGFTIVISIRYFKKVHKYKKDKAKLEREQKDKQEKIEKEKRNKELSSIHREEVKKAARSESLELEFNSKGEIDTHGKDCGRRNSKT